MNRRAISIAIVALTSCLPDRTFRPAGARMDVAADDRPEVEVAEVSDADVAVADGADADEMDTGVVDADATDADAGGTVATQRSCPTGGAEVGCGLVEIAGGSFTMNPGGGPDAGGRELAGITVGGFTMDSHEVTVARFRAFWNDGAPALPDRPIRYPNGVDVSTAGWRAEPPTLGSAPSECNWSDAPGARDLHPINCVSRRMAQAFCVWDAGGGDGGGRLPTSAEWEYAAVGRHGDGRRYPWNPAMPSPGCRGALFRGCAGDGGAPYTASVGSFPGADGLFDLAGNVSEWVADNRSSLEYLDLCWWRSERSNPLCLTAHPPSATPDAGAGDDPFTLRGGSYSDSETASPSTHPGHAQDAGYGRVGFRCVRSRVAPSPDRNNALEPACPANQVRCQRDAGCVDPLSSAIHCGRCGHACLDGQRCEQGRCVEAQRSCPTPDPTMCGVVSLPAGRYLPNPSDGMALTADVQVSAFSLDVHEVSVARFRQFWRAVTDPINPWWPRVPRSITYPSGAVVLLRPSTTGPFGGLRAPATSDRACEPDAGVNTCNWSASPASPSREAQPINGVDWWTAQAFCYWDSGETAGRLPTIAEWEYAARGTERIGLDRNRTWPWGEAADLCPRARVGECGFDRTGEVGRAVAGPSYWPFGGFYDMTGNVSEWTADVRITDGDGGVPDGGRRFIPLFDCWRRAGDGGVPADPVCVELSGESVDAVLIPGGAFDTRQAQARLDVRGGSGSARLGDWQIGFRCARSR